MRFVCLLIYSRLVRSCRSLRNCNQWFPKASESMSKRTNRIGWFCMYERLSVLHGKVHIFPAWVESVSLLWSTENDGQEDASADGRYSATSTASQHSTTRRVHPMHAKVFWQPAQTRHISASQQGRDQDVWGHRGYACRSFAGIGVFPRDRYAYPCRHAT